MPLGTDAYRKISHSFRIQVKHTENDCRHQQEEQEKDGKEKKSEKQLSNIEDPKSENGDQETARADQRAPIKHGPLTLQTPTPLMHFAATSQQLHSYAFDSFSPDPTGKGMPMRLLTFRSSCRPTLVHRPSSYCPDIRPSHPHP